MTNTQKLIISTVSAILVGVTLTGCIIQVGAHPKNIDSSDVDSVFGSVNIDAQSVTRNVTSVNGNVTLQRGVTAVDVSSVNGSVDIKDKVTVAKITAVNGSIKIGSSFTSSGDIKSVNGNIYIKEESKIEGSIVTVNGSIKISDTHVLTDIETVNGSMIIANNSVIEGDIVFKEDTNRNKPAELASLSIDSSSEVLGNIVLEREIKLNIDNPSVSAKIIRRY